MTTSSSFLTQGEGAPSDRGASSLPLTAPTLAATFDARDSEEIEQYVAELPKERVVEALHLVADLRKTLSIAERMLSSRIDAEQILGTGEVWTAPDGNEYMWAGDRSRKCDDVEGFRAALRELLGANMSPLAIRAFREAFRTETRVMLLEIDKLVKFAPEVADTVRDFIRWDESRTKHLRPLSEEGK
jgi:hypothetical protein